jgi:hypothetical protein
MKQKTKIEPQNSWPMPLSLVVMLAALVVYGLAVNAAPETKHAYTIFAFGLAGLSVALFTGGKGWL